MIIHWLMTDGSPCNVTLNDLWGKGKRGIGIGGSEYYMLTLAEAWHNAGHEVIMYNFEDGFNYQGSPWEHRPKSAFDSNDKRDVLINFRTPNPKATIAKGLKVWLSCDQYTSADFKPFAPHMDKIVVISDFHKNYFKSTYGIDNSIVIDIPIRLDDLTEQTEKIDKKCIFTSVPDRGLEDLYRIWTATVRRKVPEAKLTITSDYRLWGAGELNAPHRVRWMYEEGVTFLGAVPREQLIREQLSAQLLVYPSTYDELFCVAVAESEACGVYPITSDTGALSTTNMGLVIPRSTPNFHFEFAFRVVELLNDPELSKKQMEVKQKAIERFSIENIMEQWENRVFNG